MKANFAKSHFLLISKVSQNENVIKNIKFETKTKINWTDNKLNFQSHMSSPGPRKGSQAVAQMPGYNEGTYQFTTLVLMMYIRSIHNKINWIYERALRIVYTNKLSTIGNLLEKDQAFKIHIRNLQILLNEISRVKTE